jgi:general secretion pathway protein D
MKNLIPILAFLLTLFSFTQYGESAKTSSHISTGTMNLYAMSRAPMTEDMEETGSESEFPPGPTAIRPSQQPPSPPATFDQEDVQPDSPPEAAEPETVVEHGELPPVPPGVAVDRPEATPPPEPEDQAKPDTSFSQDQIKAFISPSKPKSPEENYIILNFDNAALKDVINTIGSITGENFIVSPGLDARITIHSTDKIPVEEAMNVFEAVLEINNMALVRSGRFFKIVPASTAKQKPIELQKGSDPEDVYPRDRIITQIIQVNYVPVTEISKVLQPMMSQFGGIIPEPRLNLLIINEQASNLKRLLGILEEVDVNAFENTRMVFFQPKYSDVSGLTEDLKEILTGLNIAQQGVAVIPIERINSLLVFAASPSILQTVTGWLRKLDEEVSAMGQNIFVYPVQNVKAEDIASVLQTIYGAERTTKTTSIKLATPPTPATAKKGAKPPARPVARKTAKTQAEEVEVEIVVYEPTNSLVILASPGIYRDMKETIKKLDVYPQEVLIEGIVAEVTLSNSDDFGVQWSVLHDVHVEGDDFIGFTSNRSTDAPLIPSNIGTDEAVRSVLASGFSYLFYDPGKLIALVHALTSRGDVKILSSPRLLVRDQEEASIEVGSDIPTATSTTASTAETVLTQNIEYRTVGIKLKIKPTINDERTVVLDITQEVSSKGADQEVGGETFPSFNITKTETSVIVPDKKGIVIGGIMEETNDQSYQGIPVFSSIPVLGQLFRYTSDTITKKELIIMITPHVVATSDEADVLTQEFLGKIRQVKHFLTEESSLDTSVIDAPATDNQ